MQALQTPDMPYMYAPQPQMGAPYQPMAERYMVPHMPDHKDQDPQIHHKKRKTGVTDEERKFECKHCEKKYLSYPALYTHIKTKHKSNLNAQISTGSTRGRGRPKKNVDPSTDNKAKTQEYFINSDKKGQTTDVLVALDEVLISLYQTKDHPMHTVLENIRNQNTGKIGGLPKKCDEILGEYLLHVASICKRESFLVVAKFVLLYRECFNAGQEKRSMTEAGDKLPEKSNDFVTSFVGEKLGNTDAIDLTMNLCEWLFSNSYTCLKLSLIPR